MTRTQTLESMTKELYAFSKNYKKQHEAGIAKEFADTANAVNHLINVYNYGYEGYEVDVLNTHISQKLTSLHRIIKVKHSDQKDTTSVSILGTLYNYSTLIKMNN